MNRLPPFRSNARDLTLPALFMPRGAQLLATHAQMEQSQWWPEEKLRAAQALQLASQFRHAREHVPYYRERFAGFELPDATEDFWSFWSSLPILTRDDIHAAGKALFTTAKLAGHGRVRDVSTSGSTGKPLHAKTTQMVDHFYTAISLREILWARRDLSKKLAAIRPDQVQTLTGIKKDQWGKPAHYLFASGPASLLYSSVSIAGQVDWLLEQQPAYLLSMPSNFEGIAEELDKRGARIDSLEQLISYAEVLKPATRSRLEAAFGVPIMDMYSAVEMGYIALQCPDHTHYHVQSEVIFTEVLNDDGQPCQPGETGRIILTPLHNFASPLIRYEIGDYVEVAGPCPCGRGLPVLKQVMGRVRNLITLPNGERHWPYLAIGHWSEIAPVIQGQVVQKTLNDLEVRLVVKRELTAEEERKLADYISGQVRHTFNYSFTYHDDLARGRNRKFEDFISEI